MQKLNAEQIEALAKEIREYLLVSKMWQDVDIYFNGKKYTTYDAKTGRFYYNDKKHLIEKEDEDPADYFEYVNPNHILSMSFEGPVCEMLYYNEHATAKRGFDAIFAKYGLYYELGNHWNFTCYYI